MEISRTSNCVFHGLPLCNTLHLNAPPCNNRHVSHLSLRFETSGHQPPPAAASSPNQWLPIFFSPNLKHNSLIYTWTHYDAFISKKITWHFCSHTHTSKSSPNELLGVLLEHQFWIFVDVLKCTIFLALKTFDVRIQ